MEREEKQKALEAALGQIEKQFGKGAVMKLGDSSDTMNIETIPTGSLSLDIALGLVVFLRDVLLRYMDLRVVVRPQLLFT